MLRNKVNMRENDVHSSFCAYEGKRDFYSDFMIKHGLHKAYIKCFFSIIAVLLCICSCHSEGVLTITCSSFFCAHFSQVSTELLIHVTGLWK